MDIKKAESPWVLVELGNVVYAISTNSVLSLNQMTTATPTPKSPEETRGIVEFRNRLIQLLDTRILLGIKSVEEEIQEFSQMMDQRFNDHRNWVNTLEKCIKEDTEFTLTTDPHKCAFGKWYDNYNPKNTNIAFLSIFAKFDEPHKAIHQTAVTAMKLISKGEKEKAIELIKSAEKAELNQMLKLFDEIKIAYKDSKKEIIVVIGTEKKCVGLAVDQIAGIENLSDFDEKLIKQSLTTTKYIIGTAKRKNGTIALILNDEPILKKYH